MEWERGLFTKQHIRYERLPRHIQNTGQPECPRAAWTDYLRSHHQMLLPTPEPLLPVLAGEGRKQVQPNSGKKKKKKVKSPLSHLLHNSMSSSPLGSSSLPGCGAVNFSEHSKTLNYSIRPAASEAMLIHIAAKESTSSSGPAVRIRVSASSQKDPKTLNSALFDLNREAAGQRRERCFPSPGLGWPNSAPLRQKRPDPGHPKFYCWTPRRTHPWERGRTSQDFP